MDAEFIRDRITALRISQGLSEYALSRQLGRNKRANSLRLRQRCFLMKSNPIR